MSLQARDYRVEAFPLPASMERRTRVRFPFELKVRFRTLGESYPISGSGSVLNMSSGGVLIAYEQEIGTGTLMELSIEWPVLLEGRIPLQLVAVGSVVRCDIIHFAVALEQYHFRTAGGTVLGGDEECGELPNKTGKKTASA